MSKIISEVIKTNVDIREALSGDIEKIRKALNDFEETYKDLYLNIEIQIVDEGDYDCSYTSFQLLGFRYETEEEEEKRLEKEEKDRKRRLEQLEKSKQWRNSMTLEDFLDSLLDSGWELTDLYRKMGGGYNLELYKGAEYPNDISTTGWFVTESLTIKGCFEEAYKRLVKDKNEVS